ncbi:MAG: efflux RND transporter periplasmic adaptor subunit [Acidobacteriaceae bacterium]|nr:efflux RND transporter periplasmic adaptor subunit [Acidobacteriaceae bacterium]
MRVSFSNPVMPWLLLSCLALTGCKGKTEETPESVVSVGAEHPTIGPISEEIAADAVLAPLAQAAIAPRISAPIVKELVQRGSRVHKGELLVTLEDRDLRGAALDSEGSLTQAKAAYTAATLATIPEDVQKAELDVAQARANLDLANRTAQERKLLLQQGAISQRDAETAAAAAVQAQAAYDTAVTHLANAQKTTQKTNTETAQGQLTSAQGKVEGAEAQVSYASLRSPIDGVVTDRPLFPGETAAAGSPVITVMDTTSLLAKLHISQAAAQKLAIGGAAELTIPGEADPQQASISLISPALDPGSTTVEIWLKLPNPGGRYRVGTPVHAVIRGKTIPDAVQLPVGAILPADDGSTNVLVVGSDGKAHKHAVKVGLRTTEKVQILSGVTPADLVITEGGYGLDDGTKVKVGGKDDDNGGKNDASSPGGSKE